MQRIHRKAAERVATELQRRLVDPDYAAAYQTTLKAAIEWMLRRDLEEIRAGNRSEHTFTFHRTKAGHLLRLLEVERPRRLVELTAAAVDDYISARRAEGAKDNTIHKELVVLRGALKAARRRGAWSGDIDAVVPPFAAKYVAVARFLDRDELRRLLMHLSPARGAHVAFIVATSARWSESVRARIEDVSIHGDFVRIRGTKTKSSQREVAIVLPFQHALLKHVLLHAPLRDCALFAPWVSVRRDLRVACRHAGIAPCSPNDLRRSFTHLMLEAQVPMELIAPLMGHADTRMVQRVYGKRTRAEMHQQLERFAGVSTGWDTGGTNTCESIG